MKTCFLRALLIYTCVSASELGFAGVNPITITFLGGTTDFSTIDTGSANYVVSLDSRVAPSNVPLTFNVRSTGASPGLIVHQQPSGSVPSSCSNSGINTLCGSTFSLTAGQRCCLMFSLTSNNAGSYTMQPIVSTTPYATYSGKASSLPITVSSTPGSVTLEASVSTLGLSVYNPSVNTALTGTPRKIIIHNRGTEVAENVTYSVSPALPTGSSISPASCGAITPSSPCTLTIIPGSTPSAASGDLTPTPITISIAGTNTNTLTPTINIVTYGSVYQGGYVYAVDDSTPDTGSIGGKVVTTTSQTVNNGIIWSADSSGNYDFGVAIYAISETSTAQSPDPNTKQVNAQQNCVGATNGSCNTFNIYAYYQNITASNNYAAGLCKQTINGYADWYLPSICEMGYGANGNSECGTNNSPTLQNMQSNLVDYNGLGLLAGNYWSATESSFNPQAVAWSQVFSISSSNQSSSTKSTLYNVRCSRVF